MGLLNAFFPGMGAGNGGLMTPGGTLGPNGFTEPNFFQRLAAPGVMDQMSMFAKLPDAPPSSPMGNPFMPQPPVPPQRPMQTTPPVPPPQPGVGIMEVISKMHDKPGNYGPAMDGVHPGKEKDDRALAMLPLLAFMQSYTSRELA